jgi:hypothetical protein
MEKSVPSGTIIGYDSVTGEKLFTDTNRATRLNDEPDTLPRENDTYRALNDKVYRVVGVRKGSTELQCEIDVREDPI